MLSLIKYLVPKRYSYAASKILPPAASTAARAPLVSSKPWILNLAVTSPDKKILAFLTVPDTMFAAFNANKSMTTGGERVFQTKT